MASKIVAPALKAVLEWPPDYGKGRDTVNAIEVLIQAKREAKALLAVYRAAKRYHEHRLSGANLRCEICAAMDRLERRAGGKGK